MTKGASIEGTMPRMSVDPAQSQLLPSSDLYGRGRSSAFSFEQNKATFEEDESSDDEDEKKAHSNCQLSDSAKA